MKALHLPVFERRLGWRWNSDRYADIRSEPLRYEEISHRSGNPEGGRQTAVWIAFGWGTVCSAQSFQIAAGTIVSSPAFGASAVSAGAGVCVPRTPFVPVVVSAAFAALGVAGREVRNGCGRHGGEDDDGEAELPTERPAGLAEEHQHPAIRGGWRVVLGVGLEDVNRVGDVLQVHPAAIAVLDPAQVAGKPRCPLADDHLAAMRTSAQAGRHVQRRAPVAAVRHADGLAGVDADPNLERKVRIHVGLLGESCLEIDGSPDRLASRREDGKPLVASNLDQDAAMSLDTVRDQLDELGG